jgi:protein O-mannosyl-transferase
MKKEYVVTAVFLTIFVLLVWGGLRTAEFVSADDLSSIVQNPTTVNLSLAVKTKDVLYVYRSLVHQFFGMSSGAFHVGSLLMHLVAVLLVWRFFALVFGEKVGVLTAVIFSVHPITVEAVAWLSASSYLMNAIFSFLVLWLYVKHLKTSGGKRKMNYYVVSVAVFGVFLAIRRDPWAIALPFIVACIDWFFLAVETKDDSLKTRAKRLVPFFVVTAVFVLTFVFNLAGQRATGLQSSYEFPGGNGAPWIKRVPYSTFNTTKLLVAPTKLSIFQEEVITKTQFAFMIVETILVALAFGYLWRKGFKVYAGTLAIIFISTLPLYNPTQVAWMVAERYLYIATAFFCFALAHLLLKIKKMEIFWILAVFLVGAYTMKTTARINDWQTNKKLWVSTVKTSPASYRAYNNLGDAYIKEGNLLKALKSFEQSVKILPEYADGMHNVGNVYMQLNDFENAEKWLLQAYKTNQKLYQALEKLGYMKYLQGDYEMARVYFEKALEIYPESETGKTGLAALEELGF